MDYLKQLIKKKAVKNGMWMYALQMFNTVLPLFTLPYITRILGAEKYGSFSIALNLTTYLQVLVEYGFILSATRRVAVEGDKIDLSRFFSSIVSARAVLYLLSLVIVSLFIVVEGDNFNSSIPLIILSVGLIGYCFQVNWLFQGKQDMKYISISNVAARTATTILIFILVKSPNDLWVYCVLYTLSPVISNAIGTIIAVKKYSIHFIWLPLMEIISTLKSGMYIFFTQLSSKVFGSIGVTFLGIFVSDYYVGIYSAINKIPYLLLLIWNPISQIVYPITSQKIVESFKDGRKYIRHIRNYVLLFFGVISLVISIVAKPAIFILFGKEYSPYYYLVIPQLIWLLIGIYNNFLGIQTLVGSGHDKEYSNAFQIGVFATIVINLVFIRLWGIYGAAFAPMVSEVFLGILLNYQERRLIKNMNKVEA